MPLRFCGKEKPHSLLVGMLIGSITREISIANTQKTKNKSTIWSSYTTPWQVFKELDIWSPQMLAQQSSLLSFSQYPGNKNDLVPINKWEIMKTWSMYTIAYYSALKTGENCSIPPSLHHIIVHLSGTHPAHTARWQMGLGWLLLSESFLLKYCNSLTPSFAFLHDIYFSKRSVWRENKESLWVYILWEERAWEL